eukprot:INCI4485.1.p1 GENE.INCI4485.1~~INCI4485.1.p1  ORF type:complete len:434 (+),score=88.57 INCI4485.1:291-1592(+)
MPFEPLQLSQEGSLEYLAAETTLLMDPEVVLELDTLKASGKCYLTTHRLLWVASSTAGAPHAKAIHLHSVKEVRKSSRGTFKKKHFLIVTADIQAPDSSEGTQRKQATLTLPNSSACEAWQKRVQMAVIKATRAFQQAGAAAATASNASSSSAAGGLAASDSDAKAVTSHTVGVAGRRRVRTAQIERQTKLTSSAFESIQSLKERAKDVVAMIERFARDPNNTAIVASSTGGGSSGGDAEDETKQQFQSLLQTVGIANPVLRDAYSGGAKKALKAFEQEVSLELARFIRDPLAAAGGILLLTDVYGLYNRARGSSVISPEELVEACENWARLPSVRESMVLHTFPSGVKVIREASHTDARVFEKLTELLAQPVDDEAGEGEISWRSLSALEVSVHMRVGLLIAEEYLLAAEANGLLARDDTIQGLYFFTNEFA